MGEKGIERVEWERSKFSTGLPMQEKLLFLPKPNREEIEI